jgi:hypothetical protein
MTRSELCIHGRPWRRLKRKLSGAIVAPVMTGQSIGLLQPRARSGSLSLYLSPTAPHAAPPWRYHVEYCGRAVLWLQRDRDTVPRSTPATRFSGCVSLTAVNHKLSGSQEAQRLHVIPSTAAARHSKHSGCTSFQGLLRILRMVTRALLATCAAGSRATRVSSLPRVLPVSRECA